MQAHADRVYDLLMRLVANAADAEDLAQEVFVKAWQKRSSFRGEASVSTWLYRIAVNAALDHRRKRQGWRRWLGAASAAPEAAHFDHPGVTAENREAAALLHWAVGRLPEKQAAAFLLQKEGALTGTQMAQVMSTTEGAVEALLQRAKAALRKTLSNYYETHYR